MQNRELCEAHAEWFGKLLKEIVTPVARDFMMHGMKHALEKPMAEESVWHKGTPPTSDAVYVVVVGPKDDVPIFVVAYWDGKKWIRWGWSEEETGKIMAWTMLPKWRP